MIFANHHKYFHQCLPNLVSVTFGVLAKPRHVVYWAIRVREGFRAGYLTAYHAGLDTKIG